MESPVQAKYFVTTIDYHFLGFDAYKCRNENLTIPVCLHPSALMQLLQFWIPRSDALDEALVGSLRWRFLSHEFDPKSEMITLRILQTLSRFEDVGDFSTDAVKAVLLNEALRQTLFAEKDIEKEVELVRESLRQAGMVDLEKFKEAEAEAKKLRDKVEEQASFLESERAQRRAIEERLRGLEGNQQRALDRQTVLRFALRSVFGLILLIAIPLLLNSPLTGGRRLGKAIDPVTAGLIFIWIWVTDWRGQKDPAVSKWRPFDQFHRWKIYMFSVLLAGVVIHIAGAAVWDYIREHIRP